MVTGLAILAFCTPKDTSLIIWTQEDAAEGAYQFVQALAEEFSAQRSNLTVTVVSKETASLPEEFQNASRTGEAPDLLWTVNDHVGPLAVAKRIQPVDDVVDVEKYVDSVVWRGETWAVPISSGNHLMLLYNKSILPAPPQTTDELITIGSALTTDDRYGLVWNQVEPFWLMPWLGGFGGRVFAADGVTPTLDTPEMVATLQFLSDIQNLHAITPQGINYTAADTLFREGRAAMIINGDWALQEYQNLLGDDLGVASIPQVTSTGKLPAPYTSGSYFVIPVAVGGRQLKRVADFIGYATNYDNQIRLITEIARLPALREALTDPVIVDDPLLAGSSSQVAQGTPMPSVIEMRCNWAAMKPELIAVLTEAKSAAEAARSMQTATEACISNL